MKYSSDLQVNPIILNPYFKQWCPSKNFTMQNGFTLNSSIPSYGYNLWPWTLG